jgi:hypothetical protein
MFWLIVNILPLNLNIYIYIYITTLCMHAFLPITPFKSFARHLQLNYVKFVWQNKYSLLSYHYITADKTQTQHHLQTWLCDKTITNYIFSYLIMWQENYPLYLYYLTDFVCLYNYKFLLSLYKIARSSVICYYPYPIMWQDNCELYFSYLIKKI